MCPLAELSCSGSGRRREWFSAQHDRFALALPVLWVGINTLVFLHWFDCPHSTFWSPKYGSDSAASREALEMNEWVAPALGESRTLNFKSGEFRFCLC